MKTNRTQKVVDYLLDERGVDYILDFYTTPDFVECACSIGGDIITFRVYDKDGKFTVAER